MLATSSSRPDPWQLSKQAQRFCIVADPGVLVRLPLCAWVDPKQKCKLITLDADGVPLASGEQSSRRRVSCHKNDSWAALMLDSWGAPRLAIRRRR